MLFELLSLNDFYNGVKILTRFHGGGEKGFHGKGRKELVTSSDFRSNLELVFSSFQC